MITQFPISKQIEYYGMQDFLNENPDPDFYYVKNNVRIYIHNIKNLKEMFKTSSFIFCAKEQGMYTGVILVRKSINEITKKYYVKLIAKDSRTAKDLLTILIWNCNIPLHAKVRKNNKFIDIFKNKGFRYRNEIGSQVILQRDYVEFGKIMKKEDD